MALMHCMFFAVNCNQEIYISELHFKKRTLLVGGRGKGVSASGSGGCTPPQADTPSRPRQALKWAVRILLKCTLVLVVGLHVCNGTNFQKHVKRSNITEYKNNKILHHQSYC